MKQHVINSAVCIMIFVMGCICFDLHTRQPTFVTVDIGRIIHQTAEGFAKAKLGDDQLQQRIIVFKRDLDASLTEFAHAKRVLVMPSNVMHGDVRDMTDAFIAYHNGEHVSQVSSKKEGRS